jgi:hypothetical protein
MLGTQLLGYAIGITSMLAFGYAVYLRGENALLKRKNESLVADREKAVEEMKRAIRETKAAQDNLVEAREVFMAQLKREVVAHFTQAQVNDLADLLCKMLFGPVSDMVWKERALKDEHKH